MNTCGRCGQEQDKLIDTIAGQRCRRCFDEVRNGAILGWDTVPRDPMQALHRERDQIQRKVFRREQELKGTIKPVGAITSKPFKEPLYTAAIREKLIALHAAAFGVGIVPNVPNAPKSPTDYWTSIEDGIRTIRYGALPTEPAPKEPACLGGIPHSWHYTGACTRCAYRSRLRCSNCETLLVRAQADPVKTPAMRSPPDRKCPRCENYRSGDGTYYQGCSDLFCTREDGHAEPRTCRPTTALPLAFKPGDRVRVIRCKKHSSTKHDLCKPPEGVGVVGGDKSIHDHTRVDFGANYRQTYWFTCCLVPAMLNLKCEDCGGFFHRENEKDLMGWTVCLPCSGKRFEKKGLPSQ